ncbi:hypothetical protein C8E86_4876 [Catellatospora citrea]|nr:hypothetical protein C8E86_4876 [Catellatospora citrea]
MTSSSAADERSERIMNLGHAADERSEETA